MFRSYLKIAIRNLIKNKVYSLINICGLAIGLTCFILISMYILDELSYDRFYPNAERIYRINSEIRFGDADLNMALSSDPMGAALKKDYPQVEQYTRLYTSEGAKQIKKGMTFVREDNICYADSTFFDVFRIPVIDGDLKTALNDPNSIAISEKSAIKYFKTTEAAGKTLEIGTDQKALYKVTAVYKDIPENAHFKLDFILPMSNLKYGFGNFLSHNFYTYIVLKEGVDYKVFNRKFDDIIAKYVLPQVTQFIKINTMDDFKKAGNKLEYSLIPITDIHLRSDKADELRANGDIRYVYIFSIVAVFILLIACINFINLTTARSANRAKEVGIKKTLGSQRSSLVLQFIVESMFTSCLAFIIALFLVILLLPYFNDITTKSFTASSLFNSQYLPYLLIMPLIVGVIAGYYPAFFLSSFHPIKAIKGKLTGGYSKNNMRDILVTFQFVTSLILICGTIVIYQQLNYIHTKNLGFAKDQVLIVNSTSALKNNTDAFKNEISKIAGIKNASNAGYIPVEASARNGHVFSKEAVMDAKNGLLMQFWQIDYDYIPTFGMEIKKGRNFSRSFGAADSNRVIINESTAAILGYKDPIGKKIYSSSGTLGSSEVTAYEIVGVVKNFHYESLRHTVEPLCMILGNSNWELAFKIESKNVPSIINQIEDKWKKLSPEIPFGYKFLDESFDQMYRSEQRVGKIALTFAVLTMFIACMGLFGLVTYISEQRTKEIGIRKVLGASIFNIVKLLSHDLLRLVLLSILIAFPLAYFFMHKWLQNFAYGVGISWWTFVCTGIGALLIALSTVSYRGIRAALANPVKSLRSE